MTTAKYSLGLGRILKDGRELFIKDMINDLQRLAQLEAAKKGWDAQSARELTAALVDQQTIEKLRKDLDSSKTVNSLLISQATAATNERADLKTALSMVKEERAILKTELQQLKNEKLSWIKAHSKMEGKYNALKEAIAGHTVENVKEIIGSCPTPQELEGKRLAQEFTVHSPNGPDFIMKFAIIPTVEDIEYTVHHEITDAMVRKAGGRVPCDVYSGSMWEPETIYEVQRGSDLPFICKRSNYAQCRIKKSDLEVSE